MIDEKVFAKWAKIGGKIDQLEQERRELFAILLASLNMPYEIDSLVLIKGRYHNGKPGRVLHYKVTPSLSSWKVKIVVRAIGDGGEEMGPTEWDNRSDPKLQYVVEQLNEICTPEEAGFSATRGF